MTMSKEEETRLINEALFEKLASRDPAVHQKAEDAVNAFTRQKMRQGLIVSWAYGRWCHHDQPISVLPMEHVIPRVDEIVSELFYETDEFKRQLVAEAALRAFFVGPRATDYALMLKARWDDPEQYQFVVHEDEDGPFCHELNTPGELRWQDLRKDVWGGHRIMPPVPVSNDLLGE